MVMKQFNYKLLLLFCILGAIVIIRSYFDPNGAITPDSSRYLQLSNNLLNGKGFHVISYNSPEGKTLFAIWPVGYPILIYIISKFTGLSVFWASKLLNVLVIGSCLLLLKSIFRSNAHWTGLIFFVHSFSSIYTFTWSEGSFLLFELIFCLSIFQYIKTSGKISWLLGVLFSGLMLFFTRYIGCFSFGIVGIIALIHLYRKRWLFITCLLLPSVLHNKLAGQHRSQAP